MARRSSPRVPIDPGKLAFLQPRLLAWYRAHRRDLPWRRTKDPYAIWISEIMLQQTQVQTVIPYYERFVERFPTVSDLASAELEEVLKCWAGLGYYSRARNLHAAAKQIVEQHDGVFPESFEAVLALPGIGRYTAGAILSIAHDRSVPILDGNVIRVLSRVFLISGDPDTAPVKERLWSLAEAVIPEGEAGDFNQAMMELGARVCTPFEPDCARCPLETICQARRAGIQDKLPETRKGPATVRVKEVAAVIEREGRFLIARRPPEGLWGGLWEFPRGRCVAEETLDACLVRVAQDALGVEVRVGSPLAKIKHMVMHYSIALQALRAEILSGEPKAIDYAELRWATLEEMTTLPFSAPQAKVRAVVSSVPLSQLASPLPSNTRKRG